MKRFRTILIVAIVMAFSAIPVFSAPPTEAGAQPEIRILQASPQPPKEIQEREIQAKMQTEIPLGRQLTKGELEQKLQLIPAEREKLNNAKANRKGNLTIMAAPQPPKEIQERETAAKMQTEIPLGRQLTKGELEQKLQLIPAEREKLQRVKQGYKPTSQAGKTDFSLSWLNPFHVAEAWAGTFDVTLSPANNFYNPGTYSIFNGLASGPPSYWMYPYLFNLDGIYKGNMILVVSVPATGWYIIDVVAGGRNRASLAANAFNGPVVMTWNFASSLTFWNDHVTMQYLSGGYHFFFFKPEFNFSSNTPVSSIRITSYP